MNKAASPLMGKNEVELPGRMNPVLATLAFLPMMIVVLIALSLAVEKTPLPLIMLFTLVGGCCAMLSWTALQIMLGGKITFDDEGLTIHRLLAENRFPWSSIEACKVMPATGTFGDDALIEINDRAGVGLFVKGLDRAREHDLDADVILFAGSKASLQPLMQIAKKVEAALKRAEQPASRRPARPPARAPARAAQSAGTARKPSGPRQSGNRRPAATKAKADPVAAFRNRSVQSTRSAQTDPAVQSD